MAWQHIHLVRELDLPHVEKLVLFALASRVDDKGECWPSVATLRKDTGLAQRTVQYRLRSLVARGLVSCEERRGATTILRLRLCEPCASAVQAGVQDANEKSHAVHPPVHDVHVTRASAAPEVKKELPLNLHEQPRAGGLSTTPANQSRRTSEVKDRVATPANQSQGGVGEKEDRTAKGAWWTTHAGIDAKGRELQVPPRPGEGYAEYKDRLFAVEAQRNSSG
jgi:DNA-binding transcriptional MocR family regulator